MSLNSRARARSQGKEVVALPIAVVALVAEAVAVGVVAILFMTNSRVLNAVNSTKIYSPNTKCSILKSCIKFRKNAYNLVC